MDMIQFEASESKHSQGYVPYEAYLFHDRAYDLAGEIDDEPKERCLGACCFRWREYEDIDSTWALDWIWLHPFRRGKGILRKAWPLFTQKYGAFHVERPLSPAMEKFLRIMNQNEI